MATIIIKCCIKDEEARNEHKKEKETHYPFADFFYL